MFNYCEEFLTNYIPEWYEVFNEYSDIDKEGNIFIYRKDKYGNKYWTNEKGEFHRIDGPAYIDNWVIEYRVNNKAHNINGPAHIYDRGKYYYINNIEYSKKEWEKERLKYAQSV